MELSIDQKLAYVRKALEMGAYVDIKFHNFMEQEEAEKAADEMSQVLKIPTKRWSNDGTNWLEVSNRDEKISTVIFFNEKEQEAI